MLAPAGDLLVGEVQPVKYQGGVYMVRTLALPFKDKRQVGSQVLTCASTLARTSEQFSYYYQHFTMTSRQKNTFF